MCEAAEDRWLSCSVLAARTGRSYEALRRALRKDAGAPQPRRGAGGRLEWPAEETLAWIARHRWHKPHDGVPAVCSVEGCSRPAIARGECGLHYARRAKGRPGDGEERRLGHPDGAGVYGVLDETEEGILCHECGRRFRSLGNHARLAHALTAAEYRDKHGLPRGRALIARDLRDTLGRSTRVHAIRAAHVDDHPSPSGRGERARRIDRGQAHLQCADRALRSPAHPRGAPRRPAARSMAPAKRGSVIYSNKIKGGERGRI